MGWPRAKKSSLDLEPSVLQVEVALDAVHDLVADLALVAEQHDLAALTTPWLEQRSWDGLGRGLFVLAVL
jgi:hypothetical protein